MKITFKKLFDHQKINQSTKIFFDGLAKNNFAEADSMGIESINILAQLCSEMHFLSRMISAHCRSLVSGNTQKILTEI